MAAVLAVGAEQDVASFGLITRNRLWSLGLLQSRFHDRLTKLVRGLADRKLNHIDCSVTTSILAPQIDEATDRTQCSEVKNELMWWRCGSSAEPRVPEGRRITIDRIARELLVAGILATDANDFPALVGQHSLGGHGVDRT